MVENLGHNPTFFDNSKTVLVILRSAPSAVAAAAAPPSPSRSAPEGAVAHLAARSEGHRAGQLELAFGKRVNRGGITKT